MKTARIFGSAAQFAVVFGLVSLSARESFPAADISESQLKPGAFIREWLVLSPIPISAEKAPNDEAQQAAFARDWLERAGSEEGVEPQAGGRLNIAGRDLEWRAVQSSTDIVDLNNGGPPQEFCAAYAAAAFDMPEAARILFGIGSDDGVKVWLNGKLIHQNWAGRQAQPDTDLVAADVRKGRNRLLLKIQNQQGDWGFACRWIGSETQKEILLDAAAKGDLDKIKLLLDSGTDVNARGPIGLTAYQTAHLHGRMEAADFLRAKGARPTEPLPPREILVDALFTSAFKPDSPGASVLVAKDGRILFQRAYGLADVGNRVPVAPDTKFRIGSITKQFTAAAILRLYDEGKLSLHDPLEKFVPGFPRASEVTIHHLLTHTSGIHSYTSKPDFITHATVGIRPEDLVNAIKEDPYDFNPGERWEYNNSGYFLLGVIVEKVAQKSYGEFLREAFFEPLGMSDTGVHESSAVLENEAAGYSYENGKVKKALNWDMSKAGGAGALYSTVRDLYRWNEAVWSGRVLKEATLKTAFTPVKVANDPPDQPKPTGYGYGWGIDSFRGTPEIGHGGGLNGFLSYLLRLPDENFTVAVLANAAPPLPNGNPAALAHEIAELYLGDKLPPRESPKVDPTVSPEDLKLVAGRYDYQSAVLVVTLENGKLFAQLGGQSKFEIFPRSATNYFWKVAEADVTFVKNDQGEVIQALHRQGGMTITAPRLPEIKEASVDPKTYDRYVGRYDCGGGKLILSIIREGNRLFAEITGSPKIEIYPKSETEFFCKLVNAEVTFVRDSAGNVVRANVRAPGLKAEAPRLQ